MADAHREVINGKCGCTSSRGIRCRICNKKDKTTATRKRERKRINSRARRKLKAEIDRVEFEYFNEYPDFYLNILIRQEYNDYMNEAV